MDTPVFCLPAEIMAQVFSYCTPSASPTHGSLKWLSITHVCRRWRYIALDHAALWTNIELRYPELAEIMMERSKIAILSLHTARYCHMEKDAWRLLLKKIAHQLFRLGHLSLRLYVWGRMQPLLDFIQRLTAPAPSLCSIQINSSGRLDLPDDFCSGKAPLLTRLHLQFVYLPWSSPLLSNLTHLELVGDGHTNIPTPEQLLRVLLALPRLEILRLTYIFPNHMDHLAEVPLPRLRELSISGNIGGCEGVLNNIVFPETTTLSFYCVIEQDDIDPFYAFLSHFPRIFLAQPSSTKAQRSVNTLLVDLEDLHSVPCATFSAWSEDTVPLCAFDYTSDPVVVPSPSIHIMLEWDPEQPPSDVEEDMESIFNSLPMGFAETLHIRGSCNYHHSEEGTGPLPRHLGALPFSSISVKTVVVSALSNRLPEGLNVLRRVDIAASPMRLAFPALHTLVLLGGSATLWKFPSETGGPTDLALLLDLLAYRLRNGKRVEVLVGRGCRYLQEEEVDLLREVVGDLRNLPDYNDPVEASQPPDLV